MKIFIITVIMFNAFSQDKSLLRGSKKRIRVHSYSPPKHIFLQKRLCSDMARDYHKKVLDDAISFWEGARNRFNFVKRFVPFKESLAYFWGARFDKKKPSSLFYKRVVLKNRGTRLRSEFFGNFTASDIEAIASTGEKFSDWSSILPYALSRLRWHYWKIKRASSLFGMDQISTSRDIEYLDIEKYIRSLKSARNKVQSSDFYFLDSASNRQEELYYEEAAVDRLLERFAT